MKVVMERKVPFEMTTLEKVSKIEEVNNNYVVTNDGTEYTYAIKNYVILIV